jgi:uncharacterized protein (DUF58 family)
MSDPSIIDTSVDRPNGLQALTTRGKVTLAIGAALVVTGRLTNYGELLALGVAALVAVGVGWFWIRGSVSIDIDRMVESTELEAGSEIASVIAVTNSGTQKFRGGVVYDTITRVKPEGELETPDFLPINIGRIAPNGQVATSYAFDAPTRGEFQLGPLRLERSDTFGLWRADADFDTKETIVVRPRVYDLLGDAAGHQQQAPSRTANAALNSSIAFDRLREYVVGDDLRRVHWRTSARIGQLMVRETLDEIVDDIVIILDDAVQDGLATGSPSSTNLAYECAVEIAASLAHYAALIGQSCRMLTTSGLTAHQGPGIVSVETLRLLAVTQPSPLGLDNPTAISSLRPGGRQFVLTTRGPEDPAHATLHRAVSDIGRRSPRTYLIEVAANHGTGTPLISQRRQFFSLWSCADSESFVALWPELEKA